MRRATTFLSAWLAGNVPDHCPGSISHQFPHFIARGDGSHGSTHHVPPSDPGTNDCKTGDHYKKEAHLSDDAGFQKSVLKMMEEELDVLQMIFDEEDLECQ